MTVPAIDTLSDENVDKIVDAVTHGLLSLTDETGEHLETLDDGRIIDSISWNFWEWPQAIGKYLASALQELPKSRYRCAGCLQAGLNGLVDYYSLKLSSGCAKAAQVLRILKDWFKQAHARGPPTKNVNSMAVLFSVANLLEIDQAHGGVLDAKERGIFQRWIVEWAEWVMNDLPRTPHGGFQHITFQAANTNQIWDDTLMMTVLPLAKIGVLLGRPEYVEEAKHQFLLHITYLTDTATGLWYHGWEFDEAGGGHAYAKALWGRGNCWVTMAIPLFLEIARLPNHDPVSRACVAAYQQQCRALLRNQDRSTGMWHTLINDPSSYLETSCTAGFAAGILMGLRMLSFQGLLEGDAYLDSARRAIQACIRQVDERGLVRNVSKGTALGYDLDFYRNVPIVPYPYGQSLVIVALGQWLRLQAIEM